MQSAITQHREELLIFSCNSTLNSQKRLRGSTDHTSPLNWLNDRHLCLWVSGCEISSRLPGPNPQRALDPGIKTDRKETFRITQVQRRGTILEQISNKQVLLRNTRKWVDSAQNRDYWKAPCECDIEPPDSISTCSQSLKECNFNHILSSCHLPVNYRAQQASVSSMEAVSYGSYFFIMPWSQLNLYIDVQPCKTIFYMEFE